MDFAGETAQEPRGSFDMNSTPQLSSWSVDLAGWAVIISTYHTIGLKVNRSIFIRERSRF